ncbi:MAG: putative signal transducing protein [Bacillota bacterium]
MWTVVYIAPNRHAAETIKELLSSESLLVMLRPVRCTSTGDGGPVEIMVAESEAEEANEIISRVLGS